MPVINKELILTFIKEFFGPETDTHSIQVNCVDSADQSVNIIVDLPQTLHQQSGHFETFLKNRISHTDPTKKYHIVISALKEKTPSVRHSIKKTIAIASGKGGVGKSTIAKDLAFAALRQGLKTGLLDADIHGPSIPILFDLEGARLHKRPDNKLEPIIRDHLKIMSIGFLIPPEKAVVWRGPMVMGAIEQMYRDTDWGDLDLLLIDLPPGTGDAQLTLAQKVPIDGAIMVTIPSKLALADVKRATDMFRKMGISILGLIENMSHFHCSHCKAQSPLFGGDVDYDSALSEIPILARVPFYPVGNNIENEEYKKYQDEVLKAILP